MIDEIAGYCPMGCGQTLFRADDGSVTCSFIRCPNRTAADEILNDRETEHVVEFRPDSFTIRHPLRERLSDDLMTCELHSYVESLAGPPVAPARYRARFTGVTRVWSWELLPEQEPGAPGGQ